MDAPNLHPRGADYGAEVPLLVPTDSPLVGTICIDLQRKATCGYLPGVENETAASLGDAKSCGRKALFRNSLRQRKPKYPREDSNL